MKLIILGLAVLASASAAAPQRRPTTEPLPELRPVPSRVSPPSATGATLSPPNAAATSLSPPDASSAGAVREPGPGGSTIVTRTVPTPDGNSMTVQQVEPGPN